MIFIIASLGIIGLVFLAYFYLLFFKPDKLQSEAYQLRHEAMQIYQNNSQMLDVTEEGLSRLIPNPQGRLEE